MNWLKECKWLINNHNRWGGDLRYALQGCSFPI